MSLDYSHVPLTQQFTELGIRQIELDLFADPEGGLYAKPAALTMVQGAPPVSHVDAMKQPGAKVLHVQDIDYLTTVPTLVGALMETRAWLQANPKSCPILVLLELKQSSIPGLSQPIHFDAQQLDAVDKEILSVFTSEEIILPEDVMGEHETLREAVLQKGWPRLDDARGKVLFAMDNGGELAEAYLAGHPSLRGRVMFVGVDESHPAAAFMKLNNPNRDFDKIQRLVKEGFLVRTRADAGTRESRANDSSRCKKAQLSGAHFISTDYPAPDKRFSDYRCCLPGQIVARVNPVSGASFTIPVIDLDFAKEGRLRLIAHRGGVVSDARIENNLPAIQEAIRRGHTMLEVDIRESLDGHLVVHHDENFLRFYGNDRKVSEMTWKEIQQLSSSPGEHKPLDFREFARACRGEILLMLDTKSPDHPNEFFAEMEQILKENNLLSSALVIGTEQSRKYFKGKSKVGVNRRKLESAIAYGEDVGRLYFLFAHGDMTEESVELAQRHGVLVVPSINVFHYPAAEHRKRAKTDINRLRALGVRYFQIDSIYEEFLRN